MTPGSPYYYIYNLRKVKKEKKKESKNYFGGRQGEQLSKQVSEKSLSLSPNCPRSTGPNAMVITC